MLHHTTVADLMTREVVRVRPGTPFMEIIHLLRENEVTAVPVVDGTGRPLGIVSQADLLRRDLRRPDPGGGPAATTAEGLMSSPAVCARPEWTVQEAARVMEDHHVKRLPVIDDAGRLAGIVSRGDLLRVYLRRDQAIRTEIIEDVLVRTMGEPPSSVGVEVSAGRVVLSGTVARRSLIPVLVELCGSVDGVVEVEQRLDFGTDDTEMARSA